MKTILFLPMRRSASTVKAKAVSVCTRVFIKSRCFLETAKRIELAFG